MTTSTFVEAQHPRSQGGTFAEKHHSAPTDSLIGGRDLSAETPPDVDSELAQLYYAASTAAQRISTFQGEIKRYEKYIERESRFPHRVTDYEQTIARYRAQIATLEAEVKDLQQQMIPFEDEYRRRGRWTRAFLVTGGHVHNSMNCSTCNREGRRTSFAWMTDYSGATEEEIVAAAGERACTVCFESAPVEALSRPSVMFTPDEKEAAAERAARAAKKSAAAAAKEAKAIANPDGTPLRHGYRDARTLVTAERELVEALHTLGIHDQRPYANAEHIGKEAEWSTMLVTAIAHKRGMTSDEVLAEYGAKAAKKTAATLKAWG